MNLTKNKEEDITMRTKSQNLNLTKTTPVEQDFTVLVSLQNKLINNDLSDIEGIPPANFSLEL